MLVVHYSIPMLVAVFFGTIAVVIYKTCKSRHFRVIAVGLVVFGLASLAFGGHVFWLYLRPQPESLNVELFPGIRYERRPLRHPRPNVIHIATIDLEAPGIAFRITPPDDSLGREVRADTTSSVVHELGAQLAINASFGNPAYVHHPWDFYPRIGDPVDVAGVASSDGNVYSEARPGLAVLDISRDNKVRIGSVEAPYYNAVAGRDLFNSSGFRSLDHELHPRTAVGVAPDNRKLFLVVVDGRQPGYSEGMTLEELAELFRDLGAVHALNLDGGGSSTLVVDSEHTIVDGVVNMPIHTRVVGRERPVGNHLVVFADTTP